MPDTAAIIDHPPPVFPYRAATPQDQARINREASAILTGIDDMLYKLARKRLTGLADEDTIHELVQRCRVWLWQHSLPRFNSALGFKTSTYLYQCARNFFCQEARALPRRGPGRWQEGAPCRGRLTIQTAAEELLAARAARPELMDAKVEALAQAVLADPERFLAPRQARALRAITDHPGVPMKELARRLGYRSPTTFSNLCSRMYQRLRDISIEDWESQGPPPRAVGQGSPRSRKLRAYLHAHPHADLQEITTALGYASRRAALTALTQIARRYGIRAGALEEGGNDGRAAAA